MFHGYNCHTRAFSGTPLILTVEDSNQKGDLAELVTERFRAIHVVRQSL